MCVTCWGQRGIKPEELPPAEDIKKPERKVARDEKKIEQASQKQSLPKLNCQRRFNIDVFPSRAVNFSFVLTFSPAEPLTFLLF